MQKRGSKKWLWGILIIGIAIVAASFLQLGENLVYFYTPSEALAKASELQDHTIRIGAMVKPGSVVKAGEELSMQFIASDLQGNDVNVVYRGVAPDMFKEGQGVVIEGRLQSQGGQTQMIAQTLMVKHSEEYKKPEDHKQINAEYLQKSLFKNEKPKP